MHGSGQFGIQGQVVNVPIDVQETVSGLPRSVPDDVAIDVHIKQKLMSAPVYKSGLVTKGNINVWLEYLVETPL